MRLVLLPVAAAVMMSATAAGRSAPRLPLALEVPASLPARAGEVIEIELSCAVRVSGARAPWMGGVISLTQRCRERMRRLGVGFEMQ